MSEDAKQLVENIKKETPPEKFLGKFALYFAIVCILGHIIADFAGNGVLDEFHLNIFVKILILFPAFFLFLFIGFYIAYGLFFPSIEAYNKNLSEKEVLFKINKWLFWTIVIPLILDFYVLFKKKNNRIIDDD